MCLFNSNVHQVNGTNIGELTHRAPLTYFISCFNKGEDGALMSIVHPSFQQLASVRDCWCDIELIQRLVPLP
jgi:hypothetical protein